MKHTLLKIIFILVSMVSSGLAQNTDQPVNKDHFDKVVLPGALKQIVNNFGKKALSSVVNNEANIQQVGNNNNAFINQVIGGGIKSNFASIYQSNNNNIAGINQNGSGNINSITQNGNGNEAIINVDGDNNTSKVLQNGDNNLSVQNIFASNKNIIVTQDGNDNTFIRYDTMLGPRAYIVSQKGNGMRLIITSDRLVK